MTYFLRCASLARADLFEGAVRVIDGETKIIGGDYREEYSPDELHVIPKKKVAEVEALIRELKYEFRMVNSIDDIESIKRRDDLEIAFTEKILEFVRCNCKKSDMDKIL
jgi:hypothetical protein